MSVLSLRELDSSNAEQENLLDLFQQCRESVLKVSTTPLIQDYIVVTTRCGFVQLIDTTRGTFRLFLSHLGQIPLDTPLKCLALVPSLYVSTQNPFILFSLSYSNELLIADLFGGVVDVFATFTSRPSYVRCDGDYIVCGESSGKVSAWRCSPPNSEKPERLWTLPIFDDSITHLSILGDTVVCCSADCQCVVLQVDTGSRLCTIPGQVDEVKDILTVYNDNVVLMCSATRLSLYDKAESWANAGGVALTEKIQCVSCYDTYIAAGTVSGVVQLHQFHPDSMTVSELINFDVGYGVVSLQLYDDETLVVITTAGDVWRWPLSQLLSTLHEATEEVEEVEEELAAEVEPPRPTLATQPNSYLESNPASMLESMEMEENELEAQDNTATSESSAVSSVHHPEPTTQVGVLNRDSSLDSSGELPVEGQRGALKKEYEIQEVLPKDDSHEGSPSTEDSHIVEVDATLPPVEVDTTALGEETYNEEEEEPMTRETITSEREDELVYRLSKKIGNIPEITGLRHGPRMDPRQIVAVLAQHAENNYNPAAPLPVEPGSSRMLLEHRGKILTTEFDFEKYKKEHPMEMEALTYQEPVRMPAYKLKDRVFENVSEPFQVKGHSQEGKYLMGKENTRLQGDAQDELADVTYHTFVRKRDPELEEELRRGGPNIFDHSCDSLIYHNDIPRTTVLFTEHSLKPLHQPSVILPLAFPSTPSSF
ncbi:hypothetical protein ADEAN_000459500 [Angomonas deanei]|uniref:Uncharacterized protein n=1 Tax=Angomonas deanei TaxID=59799 RepID=A0A7G2CDT3_9TRYP|nr:hypothetical protein ADEAN_000459500 [Angomonas deanei]